MITIGPGGESTVTQVQTVFITINTLWTIVTEDATLLTTRTQPLCTALDKTILAGQLNTGDSLLINDQGNIRSTRVLEVSAATNRTEKVFNLILGDSQIFIAGGFLARSKPPAENATLATASD